MSHEGKLCQNWKKPNDLIQLHMVQQKKKQLSAHFNNQREECGVTDRTMCLGGAVSRKRRNPFLMSPVGTKMLKTIPCVADKLDSAKTPICLELKQIPKSSDPTSIAKLFTGLPTEDDDCSCEDQTLSTYLPMDWSIKTRVRFFCETELPTTNLKTSQFASGVTGFVRCVNSVNSNNGLDISAATRLNQATYYWQHPHLPWMALFPRNSKQNCGILGELERKTLAEDWNESFRGLFQLLRARQCSYFYLCANTFTVLFRASGIGGCNEMHALMSPTSSGMRNSLRQEGIEFTMPLKNDVLNNLTDENLKIKCESPHSLDLETNDESCGVNREEDSEFNKNWLKSLGVNDQEIRKINTADVRKLTRNEAEEDFSDRSVVLIEGVECHAFFNFILNAKSTIATTGRLAGVPPTLLAPVAFPKATVENLLTRSKKVRMDGVDYCSIELKGIIMPTLVPYICSLLSELKDSFSATLATNKTTMAFSKVTQRMLSSITEQPGSETSTKVFDKENLSDCGLSMNLIETICRKDINAVSILERVCFNQDNGYTWS